jgi:hypothetical protein
MQKNRVRPLISTKSIPCPKQTLVLSVDLTGLLAADLTVTHQPISTLGDKR